MLTVNLEDLPLKESWTDATLSQRARSTFPLLGAAANKTTSAVYFEL